MPKAYNEMNADQKVARHSYAFRKQRLAWWNEGNRICWLCGKEITDVGDYTIDHVVPLNRGGDNGANNLRPAHGRKRVDCVGNFARKDGPKDLPAASRRW